MQWEELTAPDFAKAAKETGVCVLACGVLERHADHLPVGTDYLIVHRIACDAAEKAGAVVFPPWYFGQIYVGKAWPGNLSISPKLMFELFESVLDEIGRNGFEKIVIVNGHGGNWNLLRFLIESRLWENKPYSVYLQTDWLTPDRQAEREKLLETDLHWHACECETSMSLACHPELVKMDAVPDEPSTALGRVKDIHALTSVNWYADFPEHYAGDARPASAEKGEKLLKLNSDSLADFITAVKEDKAVPVIEKEFFGRSENPSGV